MTALGAFTQLRDFWRAAYEQAPVLSAGSRVADLSSACERWLVDHCGIENVAEEDFRANFSFKPPEPFYGRWLKADGSLDVANKVVVVMTNPGNALTWEAAHDPSISTAGLSFLELLRRYYANGFIRFDGVDRALLYDRALHNEGFSYRIGRRGYFAWGWWKLHWANMLRSLGQSEDSTEEETFLTLEMVAYSSPNSNRLTPEFLERFASVQLVANLLRLLPREGPRAIVFMNKESLWEHLVGWRFQQLRCGCGRSHTRLRSAADIPNTFLIRDQGMRFPKRENGGSCMFPNR